MAETALSWRERAAFLLRVAPHASTPRAAANLAREYLARAEKLEQRSRPDAFSGRRLNRLELPQFNKLLERAFDWRITPRASRPTARVLQREELRLLSLILDSDCGFFNCERGTFAALRAYVCGMVTFRMSPPPTLVRAAPDFRAVIRSRLLSNLLTRAATARACSHR
jgi:hypothetical protein